MVNKILHSGNEQNYKDSCHSHILNQNIAIYIHIWIDHFLSYISHHSYMEYFYKDLKLA